MGILGAANSRDCKSQLMNTRCKEDLIFDDFIRYREKLSHARIWLLNLMEYLGWRNSYYFHFIDSLNYCWPYWGVQNGVIDCLKYSSNSWGVWNHLHTYPSPFHIDSPFMLTYFNLFPIFDNKYDNLNGDESVGPFHFFSIMNVCF